MIDTTSAILALRARAQGLTVCTTGGTTLSATTTGYARSAGSFVTDGFAPGMEITPSGFATNTVDVITAVTTLTLTTAAARTAESAASGRTISVGLPAAQGWENVEITPTSGRPYLTEEFVPATNRALSVTVDTGTLEETGLYVLTWYGLSRYGVKAIRSSVDALKARFAPNTRLTSTAGDVIRVRTDTSVRMSQVIPQQDTGWSAIVLTIPWKSFTTNAIAA